MNGPQNPQLPNTENRRPGFVRIVGRVGTAVSVCALALMSGTAQTQTGGFSGIVTDATTGAPIVSIQVVVYSSGGARLTTTMTDATGTFTATNLPPATYFAVVRPAPFVSQNYVAKAWNNITCVPCNVTSATPIVVSAGVVTPGINFALSPGGGISGSATNASTGASAAAIVEIYASDGTPVYEAFVSGAVYTQRGLPAGTYFARAKQVLPQVNLVSQAYNNIPCMACDITASTPIVVTGTSTTTGIDFALSPGGIITGRVTGGLALIRFGGHLPKGEYDVDHGRHEEKTNAAELHRRVQDGGRPLGPG